MHSEKDGIGNQIPIMQAHTELTPSKDFLCFKAHIICRYFYTFGTVPRVKEAHNP